MQHSQDNETIYNEGILEKQFDKTSVLSRKSCTPQNVIRIDKASTGSSIEDWELIIVNAGDATYSINVTAQCDTDSMYTFAFIIDRNSTVEPTGSEQILAKSSTTYKITLNCTTQSSQNPDLAWGFIDIDVRESKEDWNLPFSFAYTCNDQFNYVTFDWSLIILIGISIFLMAFFTKFSRIMSFSYKSKHGRFQGISIDFTITLLYFIIYCIGFFFVFFSEDVGALGLTIKITTYVLGFSCSFFIIDEALCLSPDGSFWKRQVILNLRVCEILSFLLAGSFMLVYLITSAWYISDLISIFIMATIAKLFKFKNLKYSCCFLMTCVILDCIAASVVQLKTDQSYNSLTLKNLNCPLELQLPLLYYQYDRSCAWISLFSVAIPGQFIGFTYRFDKNKRTFQYTIFTALSLFFGYCIWILTTVVQTYSFPSSVFLYPSILLSTILISFKRNEFQSIWDANFFDEFLEKTYRLSNLYGKQDVLAAKVNLLEGLDSCPDEQPSRRESKMI